MAEVPVSGRVTGPDGAGLPGVTVLVRGTTIGTSTNSDGAFTLNAPEGSTLVFSFVGYTTQAAAVGAGPISVSLKEDTQKLNEVVVVGYGTQQRGSVTGAVSSVSAREIASQPVADATQALQGRAAGVTVTSSGGASGTSIRVRGITSAGNNNPLYVVDGFPLPEGGDNQLNAISPNDIETIDILKDASATAIYGVRAANGVVIITTKRGKAGISTINVDGYRRVQQVWRKLNLLNAREYAVINNENRIAGGFAITVDTLRNPQALGEGTNWQDEVFRRAAMQNYLLSATGGSEKARYAVAASYFQQDGTIVGSQFERFTLRANGDVQVNKMLKLGNSISLTHLADRQINSGGGTDGSRNNEYGTVSQLLRIPATLPLFRPDGYYYEPRSSDNFIEENPLASATRTNQKFNRNRALTTFFVELEPVKGLRLRTNVGADLIFDNFNSFGPSVPELKVDNQTYNTRYNIAGASATSNYNQSYLIENTATYDHLFGDRHQVTVLVGQAAQIIDKQNVGAYRTGYLSNDLQVINSGPVNTQLSNSGTVEPRTKLASYFSHLNYEFAGKYLFQAIVRYDGVSSFQPGEKFGFFPGASAGWRISEEEFMKGNRTISNLKLRVGYGKVGNPNNAGRFAYLFTVNSGSLYPFGPSGTLLTGAAPTRLANDDLRWETNNQANVGEYLGFLENRFEATIDLYDRTSPNLIAPVPVSLVSGTYQSVDRNAASAYNRGIDVSLTSHNLQGTGGDLNWSTTLNISAFKTKLDALGVGSPYDGLSALSGVIVRYDQGQPFGSFYGYVADGLFQTPEDVKNHAVQTAGANPQTSTVPGDIRFKDLNGDGIINAANQTFIGNPNPKFTYGVNNTVTWKGFDLNVFLQGSQGNKIYNQNSYLLEIALYSNSSGSARVLERWTGPGTNNAVMASVAPYAAGTKRISVKFRSPAVGVQVQAVLQNGVKSNTNQYPNGKFGGDFNATTTVANAWETLTFTYTAAGAGNFDPTVAATDVDQLVLLVASNTNNAATYYLDDITGPELIAGPTSALAVTQLYDNFQGTRAIKYIAYKSSGGLKVDTLNPAPSTANNSTRVARYTRSTNQYDALVVQPRGAALADVTNFKNNTQRMTMKVFSPAPGITFQITLQDSTVAGATNYPAGRNSEYLATTTATNAWETLTFNYANTPSATPNTGLNEIVLLVASNTIVRKRVYIDDWTGPSLVGYIPTATRAVQTTSAAFAPAYPNPTSGLTQPPFSLQKPAVVSLAVFDNVGRRVAQVLDGESRPAGQFTAELNAAKLAPGLYTCCLTVDGVALTRPLSVE